jgi:uncharacterized protein (TIGR00369 family)
MNIIAKPQAPRGRDWQTRPAKPRVPGQLMTYADLGIDVPFLDHLDVKVLPMEDGSLQIVVDLARMHMNGGMTTHGGVVMTLLDMAMAAASRHGDERHRFCVTVEMKTSFLRPAGVPGEQLFARGSLRQGGGSLAFCDGELRDQNGTLLATASGTFKYVNPRQASGDA